MADFRSLRRRLREISNRRGPAGTVKLGDPSIDVSACYGDADFSPDRAWRLIARDDRCELWQHKKTGEKRARFVRRISDEELQRRGGDLGFL